MAELPNFAETAINSLQAGRQLRQQQMRDQALQMAGSDPGAAQNALLQAGDYQGAAAVGQVAAQQRQLKTQATIAPMIQNNDYQGASAAAVAGGQPELAASLQKLDAGQREKAKDAADAFATTAFGLSQIPLDQGPDPLASRKAALQKVAPHLLQMGLKPEQLNAADLSDQGLKGIAVQALSVKDQITQQQQKDALNATTAHNAATEKQAATNAVETSRHNRADERTAAARAASDGWQMMLDKDGTPFRINSRTGQAVTVNGGTPYQPQSLVKPGANNPRSAAAMAVKAFVDANPDATPDDIMQFNSKLRAQAKATSDFATGAQGKTVNSLNVAVQHLDQLGQLADALGNNNLPLVNKIGQAWTLQTGGAAPTNFNAAKQIVADEVVKAVVGSGGGVGDRDQAQRAILSTNSPAQLKQAIQTYKGLMAGQLNGLRLQYQNSTGLNDFETHLAPSTKAELETHAAAPSGGSVIHYDAKGNRVK